jgi:hypothetical protein
MLNTADLHTVVESLELHPNFCADDVQFIFSQAIGYYEFTFPASSQQHQQPAASAFC